MSFLSEYLASFIFFFAVIDPIGSIPVFIAVTRMDSIADKRKIALKAVLSATAILVFFVVVGEIILDAMSIHLSAFQIAGGIVLLLFALTMIFGESKPESEKKLQVDISEKAIYPLAVPSIASPGAMLAAVLLTENDKHGLLDQSMITISMLLVLLITYIFLLLAGRIHSIIGDSGASIISRVMGLILSSVAVENILSGIDSFFHITQ